MAATTSIGQRFTQLIQQLGLSKNAFAMSLDKTATVIQHLVDERNKPGYDLICKVFEIYPNVSKDWLLLGDGPMLLNAAGAPAADALVAAAQPTALALPTASAPVKPLDAPATPSFPAPLFTVSPARPAAQATTPLPTEIEPPITPPATVPPAPPAASAPPAPDAAPIAVQPEATSATLATPASSPITTATPPAPDATYLTAALHAQYLQHQLDLAEQRNQHLVAQQQLMQQMLDMLKRTA
jgi:plasmid maintenance system antidote protein VapI